MAVTVETIRIQYEADMADLLAEIKKMPKAARAEGMASLKELKKTFKAATADAKKAAKAQQDAFKKTEQTFEGVKRVADAMGGSVGGAAGTVEHLGKSALALTGALGPAGVAITAAGIAAAAFGLAGVKAALSANELRMELEELGREPVLTNDQIRKVEETDAAMAELSASAKELVVVFGAEFSDSVNSVLHLMDDLIDFSADVVRGFAAVSDATSGVARAYTAIVSLGMSEVYESISVESDKASEAEHAQTQATRELKKAFDELDESIAKVIETEDALIAKEFAERIKAEEDAAASSAAFAQKQMEDRESRQRKEAERRRKEEVAAAKKRSAELAKEQAEADKEAEAALRATKDLQLSIHLEHMDRLDERNKIAEQAEVDAMQASMRRIEELAVFRKSQVDSIIDSAIDASNQLAELAQAQFERDQDRAEKAHADAQGKVEELIAQRKELTEEIATASGKEKQRLQQQLKVTKAALAFQRTRVREEAEAAEKSYRRARALALAQIAINSAAALLKGFAEVGPPPAPASFGVIASVASATALQTAAVLAVPAPQTAHDGAMISGGPDDVGIRARRGEAVISQRGVDALGGADGVAALSSGKASSGGQFAVVLDGRTIARGVADRVRDQLEASGFELGGAFPGSAPVYGV